MIVVKLQGGLGNQLFQYSAGKALSLNDNLYLDVSFYNYQHGITPRKYSLNGFPNLNANIYSGQQNGMPFIKINEPQRYEPLQNFVDKNIYLDGYFQTDKYFKNVSSLLKHDLGPSIDTTENLIRKYPNVVGNSVSLHVRRTDYIKASHVHPLQTIDYYYDGLKMIGKFDHIYIFSDDIEWCKENLKTPRTSYVEGNSDLEDLWLMSMCKNHIIANSSFSWWGAWLSDSKKVIAPKNWFGSAGPKYWNDIYCENWVVL